MVQETYRYLSEFRNIEVDLSNITMKPGTYINIHAGDQQIEVLMNCVGEVRICITPKISVHSFKEIYGESHE